jgi:hypothetical protein
MAKNPDVDAWFVDKRPASEAAMQRMRDVILAADPRIEELVQYGTIHFAYGGVIASVVQVKEKRVNLMFHRAGPIQGDFPHLEGQGRGPRFLRFTDAAEVDARADELQAILRTWCARVSPASADG